jgi:hypothetical protein
MGLSGRTAAVVTAPELIGVLAWWAVMLAAPLVFVWRVRRRRSVRAARPAGGVRVWPTRPRALSTGGGPTSVVSSSGEGSRDSSLAGRAPVGLAPGTLGPLCRYVDWRRRLELAVSGLESRLSRLPGDRWRVEPYPLTGDRRNSLLVLGETGVFVLSATYAPGHWDDVIAVHTLAGKIQQLLPAYPGRVRPAICHPFSCTRPRLWHRPDDQGRWVGAWLMGGDWVIEWLLHFRPEHGLSAGDLERFDRLAQPNWLTGAIPCAPSWPPM